MENCKFWRQSTSLRVIQYKNPLSPLHWFLDLINIRIARYANCNIYLLTILHSFFPTSESTHLLFTWLCRTFSRPDYIISKKNSHKNMVPYKAYAIVRLMNTFGRNRLSNMHQLFWAKDYLDRIPDPDIRTQFPIYGVLPRLRRKVRRHCNDFHM